MSNNLLRISACLAYNMVIYKQMKQDKKYFMEKLSCGISRMKRDNSVQFLRGPKAMVVVDSRPLYTERSSSGVVHVTYNEMVQGCTNELSPNSKYINKTKPKSTLLW